jgi:hypothetical protein
MESFLLLWLTILHTLVLPANAAVVVERNAVTLELARLVNATGMRHLVAHERARARAMRRQGRWGFEETTTLNEPITNEAFGYVAMVGVGSLPTSCMLISTL